MKRELYPDNWETIARSIKVAANWSCEFCGKPCRPPGVKLYNTEQWLSSNHPKWLSELFEAIDDEEFGVISIPKPQRFTLTTAHLDHNPANCSSENLKALCAPCHCRYDAQHHINSRRKNRLKRQEELGQLTLEL